VDVQVYADTLLGEGLDPSTIRNRLMPLRVIYRRALSRGLVHSNPTLGIELPAVRGRRDRIASVEEADAHLAALPDPDRTVWALAFFAGLRLGEILALTWERIDLPAGALQVEAGWDARTAQTVAPKSRAGHRSVPISTELRKHLVAYRLASGRSSGLLFPSERDASRPMRLDSPTRRRARKRVWDTAGLAPIGLHEARHTYASLLIAAGVNVKAISEYLGHASIAITLDRYGHLLPGSKAEAAERLDDFLARERERAKGAVSGAD
jgi:integrase